MAAPGLLLEGRYRLDSVIATGGMGEVWQGTDQVLARQVAVKLLRPEYMQDAEGPSRFRSEARHAGLLSHPNVARVFDYSEGGADERPYLVMELVEGPSLAALLADGPVGPAHAMAITAQVASGLAAAHAAGLVHRDIKPGNLLVGNEGLVKITDFGIAHAVDAAPVTQAGVLIGTWAYLAPERAAGAAASPASDLYSLGVVAYECLTGEPPFSGDPLAVVLAHQEQAVPPLPPTVPEPVAALVTSLTAKDPAARPASAAEVAVHAERLRAGLAGITPTRPDLPVLAAAIIGGAGGSEAATPAAGPASPAAAGQGNATHLVAGLAPSAYASGEDSTGLAGMRRWRRRRARARLATAVALLAGLVALAVLSLPQVPSHARLTVPTPAPHHASHTGHRRHSPASAGPGSPAAVVPAAPATSSSPSPTPSAAPSRTPSRRPAPSPTPSPPPTATPSGSPLPSGSPSSPTATPSSTSPTLAAPTKSP